MSKETAKIRRPYLFVFQGNPPAFYAYRQAPLTMATDSRGWTSRLS